VVRMVGIEPVEAESLINHYAGTRKRNLSLMEASRVVIGCRVKNYFDSAAEKTGEFMEEVNIGFGNNSQIVRVADDGLIVTKMRLGDFNRHFLETLDATEREIEGERKAVGTDIDGSEKTDEE
jgi:hypothetical protein